MESKAIARHVRIGPRKVRLVVDLVRGQHVEDALGTLNAVPKKAALIVTKLLRSAIANAEDTQNVDVDRLYIKRVYVDEGPIWGRWRARAQGRAAVIQKRTSHITLVVDEKSAREPGI